MMDIYRYVLGPLSTNTYLLKEDNKALLIDPASKPEKLIDLLGDNELLAVLLTHGHFDHIKAVDGLYQHYHCPVYLHQADEALARDKYAGADFGYYASISCPLTYPEEGKLKIGPFSLDVIYTPGHTMGSVIYLTDEAIFSGDTLFKGSIGRTDLPGGNGRILKNSLQIFRQFDKDYTIYPGHDEITKLSEELIYNPFLA